MTAAPILLALALVACSHEGPVASPGPLVGFASYHPYDDVPGINVACSPAGSTEFDPRNFGLMVTALQDRLFDERGKAEVCHQRAVGTSPPPDGRGVTVRIIDRTQDHTSNGGRRYLDLAPQAFTRIGDLA